MQSFVSETVFEQSGGVTLMGRGKVASGAYFLTTNIASITLKVFDKQNQGAPINGDSGESVTVASAIYDTLRTTNPTSSATIWTVDSTGFNFFFQASATHLPEGGRNYVFEFKITDTSGNVGWAVFEVPTLNLFSV